MPRKKITYRPLQLSLFDQPLLNSGGEEMPVHPSIVDFVVKAPERGAVGKGGALSLSPLEAPIAERKKSDPMLFLSFGSGSSGNCSYVGDSKGGFLIDAGVDVDTVKEGLRANGLSFDNIYGVCLTHDHSDHVRYVYTLVRRQKHIHVYCTPKTFGGIMRRHSISRRLKDYHRAIYKEFPFVIGNFEITPFEVSHDGTDNAGFFITHGSEALAVATDLGCITPRVRHYMSLAQHVMIESNYNEEMLQNGHYPPYLKARIKADAGHLDNEVCSRFLGEIYSERLRNVFLCHLSQDNNTPELALKAAREALLAAGANGIGDGSSSMEARRQPVQLVALPRYERSLLYILRSEVLK